MIGLVLFSILQDKNKFGSDAEFWYVFSLIGFMWCLFASVLIYYLFKAAEIN